MREMKFVDLQSKTARLTSIKRLGGKNKIGSDIALCFLTVSRRIGLLLSNFISLR